MIGLIALKNYVFFCERIKKLYLLVLNNKIEIPLCLFSKIDNGDCKQDEEYPGPLNSGNNLVQ